jgi:putative ABC transport system ATP-binding protein
VTPVLEARHLGYTVAGRTVLADLNFTVAGGQRQAVVGPSGSGKSSLLALLAGLASPSEGEILLDGQPLTSPGRPATGVALVLQGYGLVSLLTASENVEVALRAAGRSYSQALEEATQALAEIGLGPHGDQLAEELSGGQQQRTAVARALALQPRLLIADEPTAELDPASRAVVISKMLEVTNRGGTLVLATHDPDVAARCDHILDLRSHF